MKESMTGSNEFNGFGDNTVKITDCHGKTICLIGRTSSEPKELIHFPSPVPLEVIAGVQMLLEKRKMRKAMKQGNFGKAQKFVDRKWVEVCSG